METWFWILGWSLSTLAMAGNGFIIFLVFSRRQLRTKTNAFVVSLAVADFCVGMSVVPPIFFCETASGCNIQSYWMTYLRLLFSYASVTNLCSLVLDRYIAVVKPLKYLTFMTRRRVIQMISLSWGIQLAVRMVDVLNWSIFKTPLLLDIVVWISVIFFEVLPCFVLIIGLISTLLVIFKHDRATRTLAKQLRFNHRVSFKTQEKSAVKIMVVVIRLFLLCYGFYIRCTFTHILKTGSCNYGQCKITFLVLNSAVNPVAYAVYKKDIKKEIKRSIFMAKSKRKIELS